MTSVSIRHYTVDNGLASNAIYSFHQDSKGRIWLGTVDGLHSFDGYTFREWRDNSISSLGSAISSITEDDKNQLWIGTSRGIVIFDLLKEEFKELDIAPSSGVRIKSLVYDIIFDSNKQAWIATGGEGVFRYDPTTKILRQYPAITKVNSDAVRDIMEDSSGFLWIATQKGLSRYNPIQDRFIPRSVIQKSMPFPFLRMANTIYGSGQETTVSSCSTGPTTRLVHKGSVRIIYTRSS